MTRDNLPALAVGMVFVLAWCAWPAFACGDGSCEPPPPPEPPKVGHAETTPWTVTPTRNLWYKACCRMPDGQTLFVPTVNIGKHAKALARCVALKARPACTERQMSWRME
jgi:hypothetical protein